MYIDIDIDIDIMRYLSLRVAFKPISIAHQNTID
jgi:hypothetical protein